MRISAELLERAQQWDNPLAERELSLAGLGISAIENMAAARDAFDAWDLSNNRIARIENLPRSVRLTSLYCAGNVVEQVDAKNLSENAPNLVSLALQYNNISSLLEVVTLGKACPKLKFLTLDGNPVTSKCKVIMLCVCVCVNESRCLSLDSNDCRIAHRTLSYYRVYTRILCLFFAYTQENSITDSTPLPAFPRSLVWIFARFRQRNDSERPDWWRVPQAPI